MSLIGRQRRGLGHRDQIRVSGRKGGCLQCGRGEGEIDPGLGWQVAFRRRRWGPRRCWMCWGVLV